MDTRLERDFVKRLYGAGLLSDRANDIARRQGWDKLLSLAGFDVGSPASDDSDGGVESGVDLTIQHICDLVPRPTVRAAFADAGWEFVGTGGGCVAFSLALSDGVELYIGNGGDVPTEWDDNANLGYSALDSDGCEVAAGDFATVAEALLFAQQFRSIWSLHQQAGVESAVPRWRQQFPEWPDLDVSIPADWEDISDHNDTCPSFAVREHFRVWVDHPDPLQRECGDGGRFGVHVVGDYVGDGGRGYLWQSDNWDDFLDEVERLTNPGVRCVGDDLVFVASAGGETIGYREGSTWVSIARDSDIGRRYQSFREMLRAECDR